MKEKNKHDFFCNCCGRYHKYDEDDIDDFVGNFFHTFRNIFGYGSPYDGDMMTFTLCELCLFDIAKDFRHAPELIYHRPMPEEKPHPFDYEKFESIRMEEDPHYKDVFIEGYKRIENLPKK